MASAHTRDPTITATLSKAPYPPSVQTNPPSPVNTNLSPNAAGNDLTAADLRHMTSGSNLRTASLNLRVGSRSPTSIPSSPTSVHSSSSAIFERDIELSPSSLTLPASSHHYIIEQAVPSVLDSAAELLLSEKEEGIDVVAPAVRSSGWVSPMAKSRSPSPIGSRSGTASLLFSPSAGSAALSSPPSSVTSSPLARPTIATNVTEKQIPPALMTPTSMYYSAASSTEGSPATTAGDVSATTEHPPASLPVTPPAARARLTPLSTTPPAANAKRLSFMSYSDLLNSTPASLLPLSSLTNTSEPPPHIPALMPNELAGEPNVNPRDSILLGGGFKDEWEKEGLGRGLEERLEAIM